MNIQSYANFTSCESYLYRSKLNVGLYLLNYLIQLCREESEGMSGGSGTNGIDDFLQVIATKYYEESPQIILLYDEYWDISEMIRKLTITTTKAFVSYFLPIDEEIGKRIKTNPPDHITHKLLPKSDAFMIFVKDEKGFSNILRRMSVYPWWNKRAKVIILVKEKSLLPTKGILALLDKEKIFNAVVVTSVSTRPDNVILPFDQGGFTQSRRIRRDDSFIEEEEEIIIKQLPPQAASGLQLQVVALDPYPVGGHNKESYVGRWANGELQTIRPIFQEKIDNLRQHRLRVCVFDFPPLVIRRQINETTFDYYGLEVNLLHELSRLINFTYEFYEPPEGERWGKDLGNNTWSGLIGETQRNADFGFASVFLLDNRERAVDVSTPYDQDQGCFAVPSPEALQHWLGLVLPFSWQVWVCIVAMALVAGPIFTFITRPLGMDQSLSIGRGIFYALGSLVSAQRAPKARSHALRSFIIAWLVFCWLACILYRVALIVSLTLGPSAFKIDSLSQLARAGLEWGGYPEVIKTFSNTSSSVDDKLFKKFQIVTNATEALERVARKGDFALLDSGKLLRYAEKGRYFDGYTSMIHVAKECPTRYNVGIVMPVGSPFLERINELIRRLQNSGIIEKWYNDILHEAAVKNPNRKSSEGKKRDKGLDIGDLKLCLVLLLGGHFIGFLALLGEHVMHSYQSGKIAAIGSSIIRKVSTVAGVSVRSLTPSKGAEDEPASVNPSIIVTETDDTDQESIRSESLRSLPLDLEYGWGNSVEEDERAHCAVSTSLGDIQYVSRHHFRRMEEE